MPVFEIEQYELHSVTYRVEADSEAKAIKALYDGEATQIDDSHDYIQIAEDFGLPVDDDAELQSELISIGISVGESHIPSVRSIKRIN